MPTSKTSKATKQTVSLTINSGIYAEAKKLGINASEIAEQALAREVARRRVEVIKAEIAQDIAACDAYQRKHGSFAEMMREYFRKPDDE